MLESLLFNSPYAVARHLSRKMGDINVALRTGLRNISYLSLVFNMLRKKLAKKV